MKKILNAVFSLVVMFIFCSVSVSFAHEDPNEVRSGIVSGQVMIKGDGPMAGGTVFFFNEDAGPPPSATRYWRVPREAFGIDSNGRFTAEIPEGKYYMGALKKNSGEPIGPPQNGDPFFISQDESGKPKLHSVKKGAAVDAGIMEAAPFNRAALAKDGVTAIEGTVSGVDGKAIEGILVFAFSTQTIVGRPLFVSDRTGKDGKYLLRVAAGGAFYLRLRENYGGGPLRDGELKGIYGDKEPPSPVNVKTGETIKNIDITAYRFQGRGPRGPVPVKE